MYVVITDFSLQSQRSEKPGTELGMPWACAAPVPVGGARRGLPHTKWRDTRPDPGLRRLPPSESLRDCGRGCARAPPAPVHDTVHSHRYGASLRFAGHLGDVSAAMSYTGWEHSLYEAYGPALRACMTRCTHLRLGAPVGAAMSYTRQAGEGWAGRLTSAGRAARYRSRALPGSGCPLRPRRRGERWGWRGGKEDGRETAGRGGSAERVREQASCHESGQQG